MLLSVITAEVVEHQCNVFFGDKAYLFEELAELVAYFGMAGFIANLGFFKIFQPVERKINDIGQFRYNH